LLARPLVSAFGTGRTVGQNRKLVADFISRVLHSTNTNQNQRYGTGVELVSKGREMTDYEQLARDLGTTPAGAVKLARAAWRGEPMTDREAGLVAAWEARTAEAPWHPETATPIGEN
jgi:hypothetical protein